MSGAILTARALWLLGVMRMDRASIHSHPCAQWLKAPTSSPVIPNVTASSTKLMLMLHTTHFLLRKVDHTQKLFCFPGQI